MNGAEDVPNSIRTRMVQAGISAPAIRAFEDSYLRMCAGGDGMISESSIEVVDSVPRFAELSLPSGNLEGLARELVVIKLNGGLGTGMGLNRAKSLLEVKDGLNFLDLIARQVLALRQSVHPDIRFLLMNSFSTREDSLSYLDKYPGLSQGFPLDFLQSKVPKIDAETLEPVDWKEDPALEWCPPGHGDLYLSLFASGLLDDCLQAGVKFAFISNSDNLGAYPDFRIIDYLKREEIPFLMEVTRRTAADRKGGHLARRKEDGRLVLREGAQCPDEDLEVFQDVDRHRFFNTNNLWIRLDYLRAAVSGQGGFLSLPLICNKKNVDPTRPDSKTVYQLETAMGAAIECFERAGALEVPRSRFAPVKKTDDLIALRSDAYELTDSWQVQLTAERSGVPPTISLDSSYYKFIQDFDRLVKRPPSLKACQSLSISGPVAFEENIILEGKISLINDSDSPVALAPGHYRDQTVNVTGMG